MPWSLDRLRIKGPHILFCGLLGITAVVKAGALALAVVLGVYTYFGVGRLGRRVRAAYRARLPAYRAARAVRAARRADRWFGRAAKWEDRWDRLKAALHDDSFW